MAKKYIVDLKEAELFQVRSLIKTGKHKARTINCDRWVLNMAEISKLPVVLMYDVSVLNLTEITSVTY
ncbi:hypothetical protein JYQ62_09085 [Nostoc sp. UHCC 0702]|nr:hypothetical protein JYQ62_09085 [Nostoc sp. UHCC 0702]